MVISSLDVARRPRKIYNLVPNHSRGGRYLESGPIRENSDSAFYDNDGRLCFGRRIRRRRRLAARKATSSLGREHATTSPTLIRFSCVSSRLRPSAQSRYYPASGDDCSFVYYSARESQLKFTSITQQTTIGFCHLKVHVQTHKKTHEVHNNPTANLKNNFYHKTHHEQDTESSTTGSNCSNIRPTLTLVDK